MIHQEIRESVTLLSSDLKIFGCLHLPNMTPGNAPKQFPAVLFCHGFGGNKSGKFRLLVKLAEHLAEVGIASLRVDFRGAGDSEGDLRDTTIQSQLQDALISCNFLKKHPSIDQTRIGIIGRSFGGLIAVQTAAVESLKAIVLWAPVFDAKPWMSFSASDTKKRVPLMSDAEYKSDRLSFTPNGRVAFYGEELKDEFIKECHALRTKDELKKLENCPLLHIQGKNDHAIEKYHIEQYEQCRENLGAISKFLLLSHSGHDFASKQEQEILLKETVEWFQKYL